MPNSSFFRYSVGMTFLLVVGLTFFLGRNNPERRSLTRQRVRPPALPAPKKLDRRIPDKFKPIGEKSLDLELEAKAEALPELEEEVLVKHRRVFNSDRKSSWREHGDLAKEGYQGWFGGSGKEPGHFAYPRAMVLAPNDKLYIVDKSGRIQRFGERGQLEIVIRTPRINRGKPTGLGIDRQGRVLVADTHYARVLIYSADLELVKEFGSQGSKAGHFLFVTDVCQAADGRLFVTDYGDTVARVQIFDEAGGHLKSFGTFGTRAGEFQRPMALSIDEKRKELFVADAVNHRIQVFDLDGQFKRILGSLGSLPGELKYPYDVTVDKRGRLWIAEFGNHRLQVISSESGKSLGMIGRAGRRMGELAFPWGVCLSSDGRFFFLDSGNDRVYTGLLRAVLKKGQVP
jgi:sugar lactone lactonase YvrE